MLKIINRRSRRSQKPEPTPTIAELAAVEDAQARRDDELARVDWTNRIAEARAGRITTRQPFADVDTPASLLIPPPTRKPMSRVAATVILALLILVILGLVIWAARP